MTLDHNQQISTERLGLPEVLTARDLEGLLKIDVKTIYHYVRSGLIPYVRIQSNVRFLRPQILEWIRDHNYRPKRLVNRRSRPQDVVRNP
jgi:predicted site-specific integrase-resolvase